jgi:Na+/melibiose symporter-like transporter
MTQAELQHPRVSRAAFWIGWILSAIPILLLMMSGAMKLMNAAPVAEMFQKLGWPEQYVLGLGILEIACAVVYLLPQTSVLGAILMTGYLGGAIATHVRVGEFGIVPQIGLGIAVWLGLYLRDPRLRSLAPLRS